jgi:hypothetical protein
MGDTNVNIRQGKCQFEALVLKVNLLATAGRSLWGYMSSIHMVDHPIGVYTLVFDVGSEEGTAYQYQRVRIFKSVRRACAALILSCGCIPHSLNLSNRGKRDDYHWLIDLLVSGGLPPEGYWSADYDALCSDRAHMNPETGEFQSCSQMYCSRC